MQEMIKKCKKPNLNYLNLIFNKHFWFFFSFSGSVIWLIVQTTIHLDSSLNFLQKYLYKTHNVDDSTLFTEQKRIITIYVTCALFAKKLALLDFFTCSFQIQLAHAWKLSSNGIRKWKNRFQERASSKKTIEFYEWLEGDIFWHIVIYFWNLIHLKFLEI